MGRRTVSLNCPVLCLKGTSPDGSQVTGQSCERSTQPAPLGLPPCPQASVGHGLLSQPLRGLTLNARLCVQTVPRLCLHPQPSIKAAGTTLPGWISRN